VMLIAKNNGFIGFGFHSMNGSATPMLPSDICLGTITNGVSDVNDYYTVSPIRALNLDTGNGGTNDCTGTFSFNAGVSTYTVTRKLSTVDPNDMTITLGTVRQYVWSMSTQYSNQLYHDNGRNWFFLDMGAVGVCPVGPNLLPCSGYGTCMKGCCSCVAGTTGFDCSVITNNNITIGSGPLGVPTTGPPRPSGGTLPSVVNPADYVNSFLNGAYSLYYKIVNNDTIEVAIILQGTGWVAFGPSATGTMIMSDIVFAYYDANGPHAEDRFNTARSPACPGVCLDTDLGGTDDVLVFNGSQTGGVTHMLWRKKLVTGDKISDNDYLVGQNILVAFGWHPTNPGPAVTQHMTTTRGILSINLLTGTLGLAGKNANRIAHGSFMFIAWAFLVPIASVVARYYKRYSWWFNVHRLLNGLASMIVVIGFILAIDFWSPPHFAILHTILGLIVVLLAVVQPVLGTFADKWFDPERGRPPLFPDLTHWIFGWVSILAGLTNIALGLVDYGASNAVLYAYIAFAGLVASFLLVFFLVKKFIKSDDDDHH